ncbi:hypothetical protein [Myxacorys almedinensis]|uniref:Uncharacterized protein n=1 Tax=Myxacorys almedinensis A TaxID=2690445 RepID=A0A8J8CLB7_9CYAN|nr:hypothetical protein [Myxacorys almedinensis]NDJ15932.1 hypothetical protein [Myxacorys almedinensis A]
MEDRFSPQAWQPGGVSAPLRAVHNALVYLSYGIGFTQLFHIVPWVTRLVVQRQFERANGVMIGALITALLCGGCFVLFFPYLTAQSTMFWR